MLGRFSLIVLINCCHAISRAVCACLRAAIMHGFQGSVDFFQHCWRPTSGWSSGAVLPGAVTFFFVQQLAMQACRVREACQSGVKSDC